VTVSVETSGDPREALEILAERPPKVIVTDFRMPVMDGIEVLKAAQRIAPDTVRILLSAHADKDVVAEAINAGRVFRYLSKPWAQDNFQAIVRQAVGTHDAARRRQQEILRSERERKALQDAVDKVSDIQRSILPEMGVRDMEATAACSFTPCEHATGDYVDTMELSGGRTALLLGDVSGHGLGAAVFVFTARALLRSGLADGVGLGEVLARTNRFLCNDMAEGRFLTLLVAIHDPESGTLTYAKAGHHPALILHDGGITELTRTALPLGIVDHAEYDETRSVPFDPGMTFFAYTDGVIEARRSDCELYGTKRLHDLYLREGGLAPRKFIARVVESVREYVHGAAAEDDLTLLVYRPSLRKPAGTQPTPVR
jgi:sigma-B regulation protein RsbU (phosphoserine phosphatase)